MMTDHAHERYIIIALRQNKHIENKNSCNPIDYPLSDFACRAALRAFMTARFFLVARRAPQPREGACTGPKSPKRWHNPQKWDVRPKWRRLARRNQKE